MSKTVVGRLVMQSILDAGGTRRGASAVKAELKGIRGGVKQTNASYATMAKALPVAAVVAGFGRMMQANEQFKQSLQSSFAIMDDIAPAVKRQMRELAHEAAFQTKYSADDAAKSYYYLASAGLSPEQQQGALIPTMKFSQAGMFDASRGVDILTDTVSALGLASKNSTKYMENVVHVSDNIVMAATKANASVEQFGDALMNKGALGAKMMGYSVEEALAALEVFADTGFAKGPEAGQALWMVLRDLKNKAVENEEAFHKLGVRVFDTSGKANHLHDIIRDLENAMDGLSTKQQTKELLGLGFSQKGIAPMLNLLGRANDMLASYNEHMGAAGKTEKVAGNQLTPFNEGLHKMKTAIGEIVDSGFGGWLDGIGNDLARVAELYRDMLKESREFNEQGSSNNATPKLPGTGDLLRGATGDLGALYRLWSYTINADENINGPPAKFKAVMPPKAKAQFLPPAPAPIQPKPMLRINGLPSEQYKEMFGPDRSDIQKQLAFRMEGITDSREQGILNKWASGKMDNDQLMAELKTLDTLKQMEEAEKAIVKQKEQAKRLAEQQAQIDRQRTQSAKSILGEMLNPFEQGKLRLDQARELRDSGHLTEDEYGAYRAKLDKAAGQGYLADATLQVPDYTPVSAKTAGSQEAMSTILQDFHRGGREKEIVQVAMKQLEEDKKTAKNTGRVAKLMEENTTEMVAIPGG